MYLLLMSPYHMGHILSYSYTSVTLTPATVQQPKASAIVCEYIPVAPHAHMHCMPSSFVFGSVSHIARAPKCGQRASRPMRFLLKSWVI